MKPKLTFLLSLIFLFLYPSISFSQTFKCEFIQEKFRSGKPNKATCSGTPENAFSGGRVTHPRNQHCDVDESVMSYFDFIDFNVNLDLKIITYPVIYGMTSHGIERMITHHKKIGDLTEQEVRKKYRSEGRKVLSNTMKVVSVNPFTEVTNMNEENNYKGKKHTSHLITYENDLIESKSMFTLYIPFNGHSIISEYVGAQTPNGQSSWVNLTFGKCVNTSN